MIIKQLKMVTSNFIQVSVDRSEETHDNIRGKGNYQNVFNALKLLQKENIKTIVSFTAHKDNVKDFEKVAQACQKAKVFKLWTDRLVPFGGGAHLLNQCLNPKETLEFFAPPQGKCCDYSYFPR